MPLPDTMERGARRARAVLRASRSMLPNPCGGGAAATAGRLLPSSSIEALTCIDVSPGGRRRACGRGERRIRIQPGRRESADGAPASDRRARYGRKLRSCQRRFIFRVRCGGSFARTEWRYCLDTASDLHVSLFHNLKTKFHFLQTPCLQSCLMSGQILSSASETGSSRKCAHRFVPFLFSLVHCSILSVERCATIVAYGDLVKDAKIKNS